MMWQGHNMVLYFLLYTTCETWMGCSNLRVLYGNSMVPYLLLYTT